jgi:UrcA family protein
LNDALDTRIADSLACIKIRDIETQEWLQETKMFTTGKKDVAALVAVLATAAVLLCPSAHARPADGEVPAIAVSYADLDLTSDAGVKALYRRLQAAAKQVCGPSTRQNVEREMERRACYRETLSHAVTKVNIEMLSALHKNASAPPRAS